MDSEMDAAFQMVAFVVIPAGGRRGENALKPATSEEQIMAMLPTLQVQHALASIYQLWHNYFSL